MNTLSKVQSLKAGDDCNCEPEVTQHGLVARNARANDRPRAQQQPGRERDEESYFHIWPAEPL